MAKLTPNIPYEDLGNSPQIAEFSAAWVMESSESVSYLALSDIRPVQCGSTVVRRASFGDIEALAGELPMLPQRSYRIGSEQGIVVLAAAVIDRRYRWVVALEPSSVVGVNELSVVPRGVVDRFGVRGFIEGDQGSGGFGDRSAVVEAKSLPRLLLRHQLRCRLIRCLG
jgi:hypothetical protein